HGSLIERGPCFQLFQPERVSMRQSIIGLGVCALVLTWAHAARSEEERSAPSLPHIREGKVLLGAERLLSVSYTSTGARQPDGVLNQTREPGWTWQGTPPALAHRAPRLALDAVL